jgi:hypothetical protein
MIKIKEINPGLIQTPASGRAVVFLNSLNGCYTILKPDGSLINLEIGGVGISDAHDVTYVTSDNDFWSWVQTIPTNVEDALDDLASSTKDIYSTIDLLLPAKASLLSTLVTSETLLYIGKIPNGLSSSWYTENVAGDTITNVIYDNNFYLEATNIRCGKANQNSTYGTVSLEKNDSIVSSYNVSLGDGTNGIIQILNLQSYNTFWEKTDIKATITATEGYNKYKLLATEAGSSLFSKFMYDNANPLPSFSSPLAVTENTKISKYLSGIEYYGLNSVFNISFTTANSFNKIYSSSGVCIASCVGLVDVNIDPVSVPVYTDNFVITNRQITLDAPNQSSLSPIFLVKATKERTAVAIVQERAVRLSGVLPPFFAMAMA